MADDINARLNALLSDPAALSQIMSLAGGMMNSQNSQAASGFPAPSQIGSGADDKESVQASLTAPKPQGLPQGLPQMKLPKDDRCELLSALKPFLRESRSDKIDMMIRVLQISKLARRR